MPFDAAIRHWPNLDAFAAYLRTVPRPVWCKGLTNHNTYIPNEMQWRGIASVESCMTTYIGKGWSAGPHLFLAAEAPSALDRGIFQLTPMSHPGVHAGPCNDDRLGIENVGDFDARPPSPAQYQFLLAVNRLLLQTWGLAPSTVNVHNECMARTCPGRYLTGAQIRADLAKAVLPPPKFTPYRTLGLPIYQRQDGTGPLAGHLQPDEAVIVDVTYANGMGHLLDGRGFVDMDGLKRQ
jgi:hypothetical protein